MDIYLLHFTKPLPRHLEDGSPFPAGHYIGSTNYLDKRLAHHRNGSGARIPRAAVKNGSELKVARVWHSPTRKLEQRLKRYKNSPALCPICNPDRALNRMKGKKS